jgi:hypothetical protein
MPTFGPNPRSLPDPAAAEAHLPAPRWQRPASDRAALDLSAAGTEARALGFSGVAHVTVDKIESDS